MTVIDCYVRNSTVFQVDNWRAEYQKEKLPEIVAAHGHEPKVWEEQGKSGESLQKRGKMLQILARVRAGESGGICCVDFGRLSRDIDIVDGLQIWQVCKEAGALIITPERVWRPGTPADDDMGFIMFWFEGRNKRAIVEKTFDGIAQRAAFYPMFRGPVAYGYDPVSVQFAMPSGKLRSTVYWKVNLDEAMVIREIWRLSLAHGPLWIAVYLNEKAATDPRYAWRCKQHLQRAAKHPDLWGAYQIKRMLANPIYRGIYQFGRRRVSPRYKALPVKTFLLEDLKVVDDETAEAVDIARSGRKQATRGRVTPTLFPKLLRCPRCGTPMIHASAGRYACAEYWARGKKACPGIYVDGDKVLAVIIPVIQDLLDEFTDDELAERNQQLMSGRRDELRRLTAEKETLERALADFLDDLYVKKTRKVPERIAQQMEANWTRQLEDVDAKLRRLDTTGDGALDPALLGCVRDWRENLGAILTSRPAPVVAAFLQALFEYIVIDWAHPEKRRYKGLRVVDVGWKDVPTGTPLSQCVSPGWNILLDRARAFRALLA